MKISGKCSWFGGPDDEGVSPDEGLAFIYEIDDAPDLFLPQQPAGTTGLARRLDPDEHYIACRWDYSVTSKEELLTIKVNVRAAKTGASFLARPADWGPHKDTGRIADLSPGLLQALGIDTDDTVEVTIPTPKKNLSIVISSGHGLLVRGASSEFMDEVDEARKVVPQVAEYLRDNGCTVYEFHDDTSTTQSQNLETIVNYHNSQNRDLDVSVHFNAYDGTAHGTECLYLTQKDLASRVATAISKSGKLTLRGDNGAVHRTNLAFLNNTEAPAILIELCFCDHQSDSAHYRKHFEAICRAIANVGSPVET